MSEIVPVDCSSIIEPSSIDEANHSFEELEAKLIKSNDGLDELSCTLTRVSSQHDKYRKKVSMAKEQMRNLMARL